MVVGPYQYPYNSYGGGFRLFCVEFNLRKEAARLKTEPNAHLPKTYLSPVKKASGRAVQDHHQLLKPAFQGNFGINFVDYLNRYRIENAKELLLTTDQSVKDIAFTAGFNSQLSDSSDFHFLYMQTYYI